MKRSPSIRRRGFHLRKLIPLSDVILDPRHLPLKSFRQKVKVFIERERFIIKTAENQKELARTLRLRHEVFYRELLEKKLLLGIDIDKFDFLCDHLIIIDKKTDTYIGTYRLISSLFSKAFYSATEFKLQSITRLPGVKLELGRACVHKDYRSGSTIALLWRGITEYMKQTGTRYLFGCSSIKSVDTVEIARIYRHLAATHPAPQSCAVVPKRKYRIRDFDEIVNELGTEDTSTGAGLLPPLVKSYLHMGAMVCGKPALDKKFRCADFLTLFDIDNSTAQVHRKYNI